MLWVYADRYGVDLPGRRDTFKATLFSHSLSTDRRSGLVWLYPDTQRPVVSGSGGIPRAVKGNFVEAGERFVAQGVQSTWTGSRDLPGLHTRGSSIRPNYRADRRATNAIAAAVKASGTVT